MRFNGAYFLVFLAFLMVEVSIAVWVHDDFIRPFVGDILVIGLVYCFVRSFLNMTTERALLATMLFAFAVEFLQLLDLTTRFDIKSKVLRTVLGTSFSLIDLVCYLVGGLIIYLVERRRNRGLR